MFANIAGNESVGLGYARKGYPSVWESMEAEKPEMWSEFKSNDVEAMIDELIQYKKALPGRPKADSHMRHS